MEVGARKAWGDHHCAQASTGACWGSDPALELVHWCKLSSPMTDKIFMS